MRTKTSRTSIAPTLQLVADSWVASLHGRADLVVLDGVREDGVGAADADRARAGRVPAETRAADVPRRKLWKLGQGRATLRRSFFLLPLMRWEGIDVAFARGSWLCRALPGGWFDLARGCLVSFELA